jgi:predicted TIM-barrel fold metal-dependent hydrolase
MIKYSHPAYVDELAAQMPGCKIIISHFGFPYMLETALIVYKNPQVYTDLSGTIDADDSIVSTSLLEQYKEDLRRAFTYYPGVRKKTLFGTDFISNETCLSEVGSYITLVKDIFLAEEQALVMGDLAQKLFFE